MNQPRLPIPPRLAVQVRFFVEMKASRQARRDFLATHHETLEISEAVEQAKAKVRKCLQRGGCRLRVGVIQAGPILASDRR